MKPKYFLFFCFLVYVLSTQYSQATVRYVNKSGTSTPPYTSWQTAADSIQKCINICSFGDTVYVANGVYNESIYVDKTINLLGSSADSTIINSAGTSEIYCIYFFQNNSTMMNFKFIAPGYNKIGVYTRMSNLKAENCIINVSDSPLSINFSSVNISNFIMRVYSFGIMDACPNDTCNSVYSNNIIIAETNSETPVKFSFGGYPTFTNNIVIGAANLRGVDIQYQRGAKITNNFVAGTSSTNIRAGEIRTDTAYFNNNLSINSKNSYSTSTAHRTVIRNNIAKDSFTGIESLLSGTTIPDYNLFWNVQQLSTGNVILGDKNIVADPMFVKDTIPTATGNYDFHLQKYSPAIDAGDPNILDKDGTRSDIGMYGGPFGETYTYQDLAPLAPRNFSAVLDSEYIRLKWNKNTEADTSFYKVYRDTVIGFTIDSTKLIASVTDTFIVQPIPHKKNKLVYKITCVDNQANESLPSVEVVVDLTSVSADDFPMTISDYILYQNYPNPFNPSTRIGYQLKERAYVKMMVYDIKGELISVLVNKEQNAGYYEVEFNVGNGLPSVPNIKGLASGIYLYRIEVIGEGNIPVYTEMKKMLMIK